MDTQPVLSDSVHYNDDCHPCAEVLAMQHCPQEVNVMGLSVKCIFNMFVAQLSD